MAYLDACDTLPAAAPAARAAPAPRPLWGADSETGRLERVLLGAPGALALLPCNAMSEASLAAGHSVSAARAQAQHDALAAALAAEGVEVATVPAEPGLPDLCFTRDTSLMTPWGMVGLRPGAAHRRGEVDAVRAAAARLGLPWLGAIGAGRIEGGDVAMLRPGLVLIGISGVRTDEAGAAALGALYRAQGWEVLVHRFDPRFLHLDTQMCMVAPDLALACRAAIGPELAATLAGRGVDLIDYGEDELARLAGNVLALGDGRVLTAGTSPRLHAKLAARGFRAIAVDLEQFVRCGGGVHCLTMPIARRPG
jgi:arginine deiminase